jgi:protein phosphatase 1 regulatory subunit 14B
MDDVNVNDKPSHGRFLTAKYPKHQMGLIRRRLAVEDWMDDQLKKLFDVSDEDYETYDTILELDEILNLDTDEERSVYIRERISSAPKSEQLRHEFVTELLEKAASL